MWKRSVILLTLAGPLGVGACAGGDGGVVPTSTAPQPVSSSISTPGPGSGGQAAVGLFRACHKRRDTSIVLVLLFENRDRALLGGFQGALDFKVSPVDPTAWPATGGAVTVDPGRNDHVRQITVPPGQPAPAEVTLEVATTAATDPTNVLATNPVTIAVPSTSCTSA